MKAFVVASVSLLMIACSSDDSVAPDAGEAGLDSTTGDATSDTTQKGDAPADTTVSDAPADTSLDDAAHCGSGQVDGDETDVDCGGLVCPKCIPGRKCLVNGDCISGTCKNDNTCQ